jgi:hypothetical protein
MPQRLRAYTSTKKTYAQAGLKIHPDQDFTNAADKRTTVEFSTALFYIPWGRFGWNWAPVTRSLGLWSHWLFVNKEPPETSAHSTFQIFSVFSRSCARQPLELAGLWLLPEEKAACDNRWILTKGDCSELFLFPGSFQGFDDSGWHYRLM